MQSTSRIKQCWCLCFAAVCWLGTRRRERGTHSHCLGRSRSLPAWHRILYFDHMLFWFDGWYTMACSCRCMVH